MKKFIFILVLLASLFSCNKTKTHDEEFIIMDRRIEIRYDYVRQVYNYVPQVFLVNDYVSFWKDSEEWYNNKELADTVTIKVVNYN